MAPKIISAVIIYLWNTILIIIKEDTIKIVSSLIKDKTYISAIHIIKNKKTNFFSYLINHPPPYSSTIKCDSCN